VRTNLKTSQQRVCFGKSTIVNEVFKTNELDRGIAIFYAEHFERDATAWEKAKGKKITKFYTQLYPKGCILCSYKLDKE